MTFNVTGQSQIDIERFVSDAHRTATQLDRFPVFALDTAHNARTDALARAVLAHRGLVQKKTRRIRRSSARAPRSMHTGQNSIAPENSFPQLGQTRLSSVFMGLTALRMQRALRKEHESPRRSLPDRTPCGRPPLATVRCTAFATDG